MRITPSPAPPTGSDGVPDRDRLVLRWGSAARDDGLPFFEDVALGSLGPVADHLALARSEGPGVFRFLRAGPGFEGEVGLDLAGARPDDLAPNYRAALVDGLRRASATRGPALGSARCLVDGAVATCDLLVLPLRSRWGDDLLLLCYLRRRATTHDLVEAIYRSSCDGLLALASVDDGSGASDFQVVSFNGAAAALFERFDDEIRWRLVSELAPRWGEDGLRDQLVAARASGRPREFAYDVARPGGRVHLRVRAAPVGDLLGVTLTEVTEIKRREESVRLLFEANPMPLLVYARPSLAVRSVNDALVRICGRPAADLLAGRWPDLFAPGERAALVAEGGGATRPEGARRAWRFLAGEGVLEVEVYASDLVMDGEPCVLASVHDVTEQRRAQAQVAYLAHHDDLTGLAKRALFRARLAEGLSSARERGEALAVLCVDLDLFKEVNDTLGHAAGDAVLRGAAARIASVLRPDDVAARLGGDEFAVMARGLSGACEAAALAERLIARVAAPYAVEGRQAVIGASVGVSLAPGDACDPDVLLHQADIALYRAKARGRGGVQVFEAGMDAEMAARRGLEADLRAALGRGEFDLYFQPIVDAASLAVLGFEALLRWFHPRRGAVPPAEFIPVAEETGAIDAIGEWVLRQACAEAARWPEGCWVAVNLSAAQFRRGDLPGTVASALAAAGLAPRRLELEITESVFLDDGAASLDVLHRLRALGVAISLDDFGTGYSSLGYLNRFPFDKIKIDRSFIRDMAEDRHGLAIVRAVVSIGASLGVRTLAEGVETDEQLRRLRAEGCTELQGFLFGRPLPAPRLPAPMAGRAESRDAA